MDEEHSQWLFDRREKAREEQAEREEDPDYEGESGAWQPVGRSPEGYTPTIAALYALTEQTNQVYRVLVAANGSGKAPEAVKMPRPVTGVDLLELYSERDDMAGLADMFNINRGS